jgi:glycerol-3-phosphate dehydrogenase (NAD(P)+)
VQGRLAVIGAGSWGTTVASLVAPRVPTILWARSSERAAAIEQHRENRVYLRGIVLPDDLRVTSDIGLAVEGAELVLMAVPVAGFRSVFTRVAPHLGAHTSVVSLAKGIEIGTRLRMSEVVRELRPATPVGVLTGPNLARELAEGQPAASVVAFDDPDRAARTQDYLHSGAFRIYTATDVVGCELAGALKNVMAIAAGISDGLGFGGNTRAALITRGLAELTRLGVASGGQVATFGGLAGVGDLAATCTSAQSRNWSVGHELARGRTLDEIVAGTEMIAEGVYAASPLVELAHEHGIEMPIAEQIAALVAGLTSPKEALAALLDRPAREEADVFGSSPATRTPGR